MTILQYATKNHDIKWVKDLIRQGVDINYRKRPYHKTALYMAAESGDLKIVKTLLNTNVKEHALCRVERETALHAAVREGHIEIVKALVAAQVGLNTYNSHTKTPLHLVFNREEPGSIGPDMKEWKRIEILKILLRSKAVNPNLPNQRGFSPLHEAVFDQAYEDIEMLLFDAGADPNIPVSSGMLWKGLTPLQFYLANSFFVYPEIVKLFCQAQDLDLTKQVVLDGEDGEYHGLDTVAICKKRILFEEYERKEIGEMEEKEEIEAHKKKMQFLHAALKILEKKMSEKL